MFRPHPSFQPFDNFAFEEGFHLAIEVSVETLPEDASPQAPEQPMSFVAMFVESRLINAGGAHGDLFETRTDTCRPGERQVSTMIVRPDLNSFFAPRTQEDYVARVRRVYHSAALEFNAIAILRDVSVRVVDTAEPLQLAGFMVGGQANAVHDQPGGGDDAGIGVGGVDDDAVHDFAGNANHDDQELQDPPAAEAELDPGSDGSDGGGDDVLQVGGQGPVDVAHQWAHNHGADEDIDMIDEQPERQAGPMAPDGGLHQEVAAQEQPAAAHQHQPREDVFDFVEDDDVVMAGAAGLIATLTYQGRMY